jgi:hypothetical protein
VTDLSIRIGFSRNQVFFFLSHFSRSYLLCTFFVSNSSKIAIIMGLITSASQSTLLSQSKLLGIYYAYVAPYLVQITLAGIAIYYLSVKFDRNLHDIPGPFLASFSSLWKTWDTYKGNSQYTGKRHPSLTDVSVDQSLLTHLAPFSSH